MATGAGGERLTTAFEAGAGAVALSGAEGAGSDGLSGRGLKYMAAANINKAGNKRAKTTFGLIMVAALYRYKQKAGQAWPVLA